MLFVFFLLTCLLSLLTALGAEEATIEAPLTEAFYADGKLVKKYTGGVKATYGGMRLAAEEAVYTKAEDKIVFIGHASAQDSSGTLTAERIAYLIADKVALAEGWVSIADGRQKLRGRKIVYARKEGRAEAVGEAEFEGEGGRRLQADRIVYWRGDDRAEATGHVDFEDPERRVRVTGGGARYRAAQRLGLFSDSPRMVKAGEGADRDLILTARQIEVASEPRRVCAEGEVQILKGPLEARCDSAEYREDAGTMALRGGPRVTHRPAPGDSADALSEMRADAVVLTLQKDTVIGAHLLGGAALRSVWTDSAGGPPRTTELKADSIAVELEGERLSRLIASGDAVGLTSTPDAPEPDRLTARGLTARFEGGRIVEMTAEGDAASFLHLAREGEHGVNRARGALIRVRWRDGRMFRVAVEGGASGSYRGEQALRRDGGPEKTAKRGRG